MRKSWLLAAMLLLLVGSVLAANTVTLNKPAASGTVGNTADYILNATLDTNTVGIVLCNFTYYHAGAYTHIADVANDSDADKDYVYNWTKASIPTYLGNVTFWVNCSNDTTMRTGDSSTGVTIKGYATTDLPLVLVDIVGTYWVQIVSLAGLLALILVVVLLNKNHVFDMFTKH